MYTHTRTHTQTHLDQIQQPLTPQYIACAPYAVSLPVSVPSPSSGTDSRTGDDATVRTVGVRRGQAP